MLMVNPVVGSKKCSTNILDRPQTHRFSLPPLVGTSWKWRFAPEVDVDDTPLAVSQWSHQ